MISKDAKVCTSTATTCWWGTFKKTWWMSWWTTFTKSLIYFLSKCEILTFPRWSNLFLAFLHNRNIGWQSFEAVASLACTPLTGCTSAKHLLVSDPWVSPWRLALGKCLPSMHNGSACGWQHPSSLPMLRDSLTIITIVRNWLSDNSLIDVVGKVVFCFGRLSQASGYGEQQHQCMQIACVEQSIDCSFFGSMRNGDSLPAWNYLYESTLDESVIFQVSRLDDKLRSKKKF